MPSSGTSAGEILLAAAAAAAGSTAASVPDVDTYRWWRTKDRQPMVRPDGLSKRVCEKPYYLMIKAAKQKGDPSAKQQQVLSYDPGYGRSWATEAAAEADRPNFKRWVDNGCIGLNAGQQAATAASSASASSSRQPRSAEPQRSSKRSKVNHAWRAVLNLTVRTLATGAAVAASVVGALAPMDPEQLRAAWQQRSAFLQESKRHRQQRAVREAQASVPEGEWEYFLARCRAVAVADEASGVLTFQPKGYRGRSQAALIGQRKKARPDQHVQRREQQARKQEARVRAAKEFRATQIARLRHALANDDCVSLLQRPTEGGAAAQQPVSGKQAGRVTTQCWAVLKVYEEIDRLETAVLDGQEQVPLGGVSKGASQAVANYFGIEPGTVSGWRLDFEAGGRFSLDGRGKWERELLIHEEDLQRKFHKWMVSTARAETLSVEAAQEYLNSTLLRPPHVSAETLADYKISLPISNKTAWFWMRQSDAKVCCQTCSQSCPRVHTPHP